MNDFAVFTLHDFQKKFPHKKVDFHLKSDAFKALNDVGFDRSFVLYVPLQKSIRDVCDLDSFLRDQSVVERERVIIFVDEGAAITVCDSLASLGRTVSNVRSCEIILAGDARSQVCGFC